MGGFLTYMRGLKPRNRFGFTFGSYGWAQIGFKELEAGMQEAGIELISPGKYFQFIPDSDQLDSLKDIVDQIKQKLS